MNNAMRMKDLGHVYSPDSPHINGARVWLASATSLRNGASAERQHEDAIRDLPCIEVCRLVRDGLITYEA